MKPTEPHRRMRPYFSVRSPRWLSVVASTSGSEALQKKLISDITTNSQQKLVPKNTPT